METGREEEVQRQMRGLINAPKHRELRRANENKGRGDVMLRLWEVGKFQSWITGALQADSVRGGRVCLDKTA